MLIATCAATTGIMKAINSFAIANNQNAGKFNITYSATPDPTMLAAAGLTSTDWNNLVSAITLSGANNTALLNFLNANGLMLCVEQLPFPVYGSIAGGTLT